jgi:hypothetical protein
MGHRGVGGVGSWELGNPARWKRTKEVRISRAARVASSWNPSQKKNRNVTKRPNSPFPSPSTDEIKPNTDRPDRVIITTTMTHRRRLMVLNDDSYE